MGLPTSFTARPLRQLVALTSSVCIFALATYQALPVPQDKTGTQLETAAAQPAEIQAPRLALPASISLRVGSGGTLLSMLTDTGVDPVEAQQALAAIRKIYDPRKLDVGAKVAVILSPSEDDPDAPVLSSMVLPISKIATVSAERTSEGNFSVKKIEEPSYKKLTTMRGTINSSFYLTGNRLGVPSSVLSELVKAYSYDVDFQRDIKKGHTLTVVMERSETKSGVVTDGGKLLFASLGLGKKTLNLYRYTDKSGNTGYYNEKGESLRKALLRTPINGAHITSGFGPRMHPLLGYTKMHRGVDFGAAQGTPIYAAGDGVIEMAGWNNGYGDYVRIKHDAKYSTAYGHASRIAAGIKPGKRVKQGQVIAYVGSTGQSTGAHLHYEVLFSGNQINPSGVKFKTGNTLSGKELAAFKERVVKPVQAAMASSAPKKVASR